MSLRDLRKQAGYSQKELALLLNIAQSSLSQYENGSRGINADTAKIFADFFNASLDDIYDYSNTAKNKEKPTTVSDDGLCKINSIFARLSDENRAKLLELSNLYLNAQNKTEENQ